MYKHDNARRKRVAFVFHWLIKYRNLLALYYYYIGIVSDY